MSNTTSSPDEFWGDLRSLMHAPHIDFHTLTRLTVEFLEDASAEMRTRAQHYIKDNFKRRRMHDEIQEEFHAHQASSCFGEQNEHVIDFADEGLTLTLPDDEGEEWEYEYERYEYEEEREWANYGTISSYQGPGAMRLLADLETMGGVQFTTQFGPDGEVLGVTCHVHEEFQGAYTWSAPPHEETMMHSVHIRCEHEFEELCFD